MNTFLSELDSADSQSDNSKLIIGLTGGIGSGKTVATDWFAGQGIAVIDADVIAHQIVKKGSPTLQKICEQFGDWVLNENGELNRSALRQYVFEHPNALIDLESITHPAIRQQILIELQQADSPYIILSAPLLLEGNEAGLAGLCQHIVVIDALEETQISRASLRDGQTMENIKSVMENQLPRSERCAKADDIVENNGTLDDLYAQLQPLHQKFLDMLG